MTAYTTISELLDHADPWGEQAVIRDVAARAGILWTCGNCTNDNVNNEVTCAHCGTPDAEQGLRSGEWQCICTATNWGSACRVCHREQPLLTA